MHEPCVILHNPRACCSLRSSEPGPDIDVVEESPEKGADGITYICFVLFSLVSVQTSAVAQPVLRSCADTMTAWGPDMWSFTQNSLREFPEKLFLQSRNAVQGSG